MLDVVEVELELAQRVKVRDGGVLLEDATRYVEMKDGIGVVEAFLGTIGVARVPVVVFEVDAMVDDAIDCERKPRIGPRICAFEFASKAIGAVSTTCTVVPEGAVSSRLLFRHSVRFRISKLLLPRPDQASVH